MQCCMFMHISPLYRDLLGTCGDCPWCWRLELIVWKPVKNRWMSSLVPNIYTIWLLASVTPMSKMMWLPSVMNRLDTVCNLSEVCSCTVPGKWGLFGDWKGIGHGNSLCVVGVFNLSWTFFTDLRAGCQLYMMPGYVVCDLLTMEGVEDGPHPPNMTDERWFHASMNTWGWFLFLWHQS